MRKILKRVPLIFWALGLAILSFYFIKKDLFAFLDDSQVKLISGFFSLIGLIFVSIQIQAQWKNERIKTEYLNQPDFKLKGFASEELENSGPMLCPNPTQCTEDHWLDLVQTGNLAAKNLRVALFHKTEAKEDVSSKERWMNERRLGKNDKFQYKLPQFKIPFRYFDKDNSNCFYLLLDYSSEYSSVRYKRVYKLCASAWMPFKSDTPNDWKGKIYFYSSNLTMTIDTESISLNDILKNRWFKLMKFLNIKRDYSLQDWLIDI